ncbi:MAG: hypothetical protein Q9175_003287 [Cornicularia normoerica]
MNLGLELTVFTDEIGDVFAKWNADGELSGTFLIDIGAHINKQRDDKGKHVLSVVEDKVVQDIDGTEGTGGSNVIDLADQESRWGTNFSKGIQIWRDGCIIEADYIAEMLEEIFKNPKDDQDLLHNNRTNAVIPSLSASLEYLKYSVNTILPTQFYEAQLDYFGKHMFDLTSELAGEPETGHHHYEWKPA